MTLPVKWSIDRSGDQLTGQWSGGQVVNPPVGG